MACWDNIQANAYRAGNLQNQASKNSPRSKVASCSGNLNSCISIYSLFLWKQLPSCALDNHSFLIAYAQWCCLLPLANGCANLLLSPRNWCFGMYSTRSPRWERPEEIMASGLRSSCRFRTLVFGTFFCIAVNYSVAFLCMYVFLPLKTIKVIVFLATKVPDW